jgi:hypothetical protein
MGNVLNHFDKARLEKDLRDDKARRDKALRELEALKQQKLNEVQIERTKAENEVEIERTKAAAGPELEKLRQATLKAVTDSKIMAMNEENRLKEHEAKLKKQEQQWEQEALERNSAIMEMRAKYEAEYKSKRQEEESALNKRHVEDQITIETARLNAEESLAAMRATVARANELEAETIRRQKQLDADLEIAREKEMAGIRNEEIKTTAAQFGSLIGKLAIPAPNYSGVHTLVLGTEGNRPGDMIATLLVDMLSRLAGTIEPQGKTIMKTQEKADARSDSVQC